MLADVDMESDDSELVLNEVDGVYIDEGLGGGFTYEFEWGEHVPVPDTELRLDMVGWYQGELSHEKKLYQWNYTASTWDAVTVGSDDFMASAGETSFFFTLLDSPDYIQFGHIKLKIMHTTGTEGHHLRINHLYISLIV